MRRSPLLCLPLVFSLAGNAAAQPPPASPGFLVVANQGDHTLLLLDLAAHTTLGKVEVGVNGHEVAVSPDGHFAYVPIYGNSGVGKPGTDGRTIDIVDLRARAIAGHLDLGKPVRPHCAKFGPDGLLYVSAELANAIFVVDPAAREVIAEIPTGAEQSHMFVISPDGRRAYTANVSGGSVSVLDLRKRTLLAVIPVAKTVQRISISPDGRYVFTHDQDAPRIAMISTANNKVVQWIAIPSRVYSSAVTPDNRRLVAASLTGQIFVINLAPPNSNAAPVVAATIDVPPAAGEILLAPDGSRAFLSCPQAGSIQVLDLSSGKRQEAFVLTKGVDGLDWLPSL
jgi:DNA-binding beta-propeller fold protein YncE